MDTIKQLQHQLKEAQYFANEETAQAVRAALVLEKPLLIEGPPGVGKTAVAHALSKIFDQKLLRVQCYDGIEADQLLYDYNYAKQLLMISMIKDQIHKKIENKSIKKAIETLDKEEVFWGENFLIKRPVLQAIVPENGKKQVLLIDEVDKTEKNAEALLLEVLSEYSVSIPEYGTVKATVKPVVVLTGNRTRQLTDALRRRCVYLYIDYPDLATEKAIVNLHEPDADEAYLARVVDAVQKIRKLPLKHISAVSETIEVVKLLIAANGESDGWINLLGKHSEDIQTIKNSGIQL